MSDTNYLVTCILSSSLAVAVVTLIKDLVLWILNRKAKKEDDSDSFDKKIEKVTDKIDKNDENIKKLIDIVQTMEGKLESCVKGNKVTLQDRIKYIALSHLKSGEIKYEDRKIIHEMWEIYHYSLGGNGDLNSIMEMIDELPIKE